MIESTEATNEAGSNDGPFADQLFGLHMLFDHEGTNTQFDSQVEAMKAQIDVAAELGTQVIRFPGDWNGFQSIDADTTNDWYVDQVMEVLSHAESHGVKIVMMFAQTPEWAASASDGDLDAADALWLPPENPQEYADAIAGLFSTVVDAGQHDTIVGWEVWNEPNTTWFWTEAELRDGTNVLVDTSEVESYVSILNAAYDTLHAVAAEKGVEVTIAGGSLAGNDVDYLRTMYELGAKFDKLALHPYTKADESDPNGYQYAPGEYNSDDPLAAIWSFEHGINAIRELMIENGDGDTGIWLTEFGWSSDDEWGATGSEEAQAQYIEEALNIISTLDFIEIATLHRLYDASTDGWGLYDLEGNIKPSGEVYVEFLESLVDVSGEEPGWDVPKLSDASVIYDDEDVNQHIDGTEGSDWFVIDGLSTDYGWGLTEDGQDHVVWNGASFDVLYDFETIVFSDRIVTLENPPQEDQQVIEEGEVGNILIGDTFDNELVGGSGADSILGGAGSDVLNGGLGADILEGGIGDDTLNGGDDTDTANYSDDDGRILGRLDAGFVTQIQPQQTFRDELESIENLTGTSGNDFIIGSTGSNTILGGAGNDRIDGRSGLDFIDGGAGNDVINADAGETIEGGSGRDTVLMSSGARLAFETVLNDVEVVYGHVGMNDIRVTGGEGNIAIFGKAENDQLSYSGNLNARILGQNGNDTISSGGGNDTLSGGNGQDVLTGGYGNDRLTGGAQADQFQFLPGTGNGDVDTILDFDDIGSDQDTIVFAGFGGEIDFDDLTITQTATNRSIVAYDHDGDASTAMARIIVVGPQTTLEADDFAFA